MAVRGRPAATAPVAAPGPQPARLEMTEEGNPLHRLFDAWGLPWREPRAAVEAREGIRRDPLYDWDTMLVSGAAALPGVLQPWNAGVSDRFAPTLPIVRFSAITWTCDDAEGNLRQIASHVAKWIGPAPIGAEYNTEVCRWQAGAAGLKMTTWPPARQSPGLSNDAHAREPRLRTAVHLTATTGFRLPLTAREEAWLEAFQPVATIDPQRTVAQDRIADIAPGETELEYAREPGKHVTRIASRIGYPPDLAALIFCTHQLFVVPREDVLSFTITRLHRAKGPGGSYLQVRCRTLSPDVPDKTLFLTQSSDPEGVTALAQALAATFDRPCDISPLFADA
ncbi:MULTISPECIES: hypothetical protein [unclassified Sphingomonas]|uniref:hypothetical protein n=1 Tax=unclassified Sphingomonas TaxID=196159 RepID=UPI0006FAEF06|nr:MULTISPECIES: hypothetical protein [unclassified Sphingomonas]KQM27396.1 hypothetical protein ASE58_10770 [Sphingomonas sp. Leaf9]KQM43733.1 hypothetical protein ASE57_10775 [Sphingomonas sp. Leaf11]